MSTPLGRVLVVDDEPQIVEMLRELVTELGYVVQTAEGGIEALRLVREFKPDVVLLDLQMPGMSGLQVLEHIRRDHPRLPVVIVTGNTDAGVARSTLARGAFDYLRKPFQFDVLARVIAAAVMVA